MTLAEKFRTTIVYCSPDLLRRLRIESRPAEEFFLTVLCGNDVLAWPVEPELIYETKVYQK